MKTVKGTTAGTSKPSKGTSKPSKDTTKPSKGTSKPSKRTSKPSKDTSKPSKGTTDPTKRMGVQSKPQFKHKSNSGGASAFKSKGKPVRNHFTFAEEKRLDRIREQNERKAEKEGKKLQAKKEKRRKLKILSKKNSKGQPVMNGRMELLLEKIEKRL